MPRKHGDVPKVNSAFKINPKLFQEAKDLTWENRISYSLQVETLIKEWVAKSKSESTGKPKIK